MQQQARRVDLREVARASPGLVPVVGVEERRQRVAAQLAKGVGRGEEPGPHRNGDEEGEHGREQPTDAVAPEPLETDRRREPEL